jgi:hypothetical protein
LPERAGAEAGKDNRVDRADATVASISTIASGEVGM